MIARVPNSNRSQRASCSSFSQLLGGRTDGRASSLSSSLFLCQQCASQHECTFLRGMSVLNRIVRMFAQCLVSVCVSPDSCTMSQHDLINSNARLSVQKGGPLRRSCVRFVHLACVAKTGRPNVPVSINHAWLVGRRSLAVVGCVAMIMAGMCSA